MGLRQPQQAKEWPFIFSGHSVRQMLAGAKNMTRRLPGPRTWSVDGGSWPRGWKFDLTSAWLDEGPSPAGNVWPYLHASRIGADTIHRLYPLVRVGHRVWARETWMPVVDAGGDSFRYAANYDAEGRAVMAELQRWRSPIFMPRLAARLTPSVTAMRVERLQQIDDHDALAEGVEGWVADPRCECPRDGFRVGWDELHGEHPGAAWKDDPWVLALTFLPPEAASGR